MRRRLRLTCATVALVLLGIVMAGCPRPNGYAAGRVAPAVDLSRMVGLYPLPGSAQEAIALTQTGVAYRVNLFDAAVAPVEWLDLSDRLIEKPGNEEGLLGLAFSPDYSSSRRFYVYYTADGPRRNVLSRFLAPDGIADAGSEEVLLQIAKTYSNHNGGTLTFGPDGMLYAAIGDGGGPGNPQSTAQNLGLLLGKILRIDVSGEGYSIPPDNPFATGGGRAEIWAYGFRNPWRISFDRATGALWAGDVGEDEWEEVNLVERGGNYGWRYMEGFGCFAEIACNADGLRLPWTIYSHDFGCAITGGYVYRGELMPELRGWYVYGDFCSGRVWAVDTESAGGPAIPLVDTDIRITAFAEDISGELYIVGSRAIHQIVRKAE